MSDLALAIRSAKEFVEPICNGILAERGLAPAGKEYLPNRVHLIREQLGLAIDRYAPQHLGCAGEPDPGVAELRGQLATGHGASPEVGRPPVEVARLADGAATTLGRR